jgi:hypothetical protein
MENQNFYAQILVSKLKKFPKLNEQTFENGKILLSPIDDNKGPSIKIDNVSKLDEAIKNYWYAINNNPTKFSVLDQRHELKYYIINVWKNATNSDYDNPIGLYERYTDFLNDKTFSEYINNPIEIGKINGYSYYFSVRENLHGFETPYEFVFFVVDSNNIENMYIFPSIRYGITEKDGRKLGYICALQNEFKPNESDFHNEIRSYLNKINENISGMKNRGVHSPNFLAAIITLTGLFHKYGINQIKINDFNINRWDYLCRQEMYTEERLFEIQRNITDKTMKTFIRLSDEINGFKVTAYPSDIDNYMYMKFGDKIYSNNRVINELYQFGYEGISKKKTI